MTLENKTILITGGAGFIGSSLAQKLVEKNKVVLLDHLSTYQKVLEKRKNLAPVLEKGAVLEKADITNSREVEKILKKHSPQIIFHQAAQAGVIYSMPEPGQRMRPWQVMKTNYQGTTNLLNAALDTQIGLEKFVNASTSAVYGNVPLPAKEQDPKQPDSYYGVSKLAAEHAARLYKQHYGLPTVSLRYFTVYGPRQRPDMAISRFIKATLRGEDIKLFGDGKQARDFVYVDDIVEGNILAAVKKTKSDAYNLGTGKKTTIKQLISLVQETVGKKTLLKYHPQQAGDTKNTLADNKLAKKELGWEPKTGLREGLVKTLKWIRKRV